MTDIVTVSYQNGHYEVYDHVNNATYTKQVYPNGIIADLDSFLVCSLVEQIIREHEFEVQHNENTD